MENRLKISRILHAGYIFEFGKTQILLDPIFENPFSVNCFAYPQVTFDQDAIERLSPQAVFISHFHDDHCSLQSLALLKRETPIYMFCLHEELFAYLRELGFAQVHPLALNHPVQIGEITITSRKALDADVDSMFQVRVAGLNILNVVDSWIDYETLELLKKEGPWDLIMWPFQTMRELAVLSPRRAEPADTEMPSEWIEQLQALNPRAIVPSSCQFIHEEWSWYRKNFFPISYATFNRQVREALPQTQILRMDPGAAVHLDLTKPATAAEPISWIEPRGPQDVDYDFDPAIEAPNTASIALNLPTLSSYEKEVVQRFCESEFVEIYRKRDAESVQYFAQARHWALVVYDGEGLPSIYHYRLGPGSAEILSDIDDPLAWVTEIPEVKLFGALHRGESLSSLYIRINDEVLSPEVEEDLRNADILEDPLLYCLFNRSVASYQEAQLKRLLAVGPSA